MLSAYLIEPQQLDHPGSYKMDYNWVGVDNIFIINNIISVAIKDEDKKLKNHLQILRNLAGIEQWNSLCILFCLTRLRGQQEPRMWLEWTGPFKVPCIGDYKLWLKLNKRYFRGHLKWGALIQAMECYCIDGYQVQGEVWFTPYPGKATAWPLHSCPTTQPLNQGPISWAKSYE